MKYLAAMFSAMTVAASASTAMAESLELAPYQAEYVITRGGSDYGTGYRKLSRTESGNWQLEGKTDISWFILSDTRATRSLFSVSQQGQQFTPLEFSYNRTGTGSDESFNASFNADAETVINVDSGEPIAVDWQQQLYDEASVVEKLRLDVAAGKTSFSYPLIDEEGRPQTYRYEVVDRPTIDTPVGGMETIKVQRIRESQRRQTYFWFAPAKHYVLVQMQQFKEGDEQAKMSLRQLNYNPAAD